VARLTAVGTETAVRKARHDAEELDELMNRMDRFSPRLAARSQRLQRCGRAFALYVSNVRGPDREVTRPGSAVAAVHSLAEVAQHHALRVAVVSVADRLCFGLLAAPAVIGDLDVLADAVEREAAELVRAGTGLVDLSGRRSVAPPSRPLIRPTRGR
jgi:diacylglycerol O-acyltransferase / wax synthase